MQQPWLIRSSSSNERVLCGLRRSPSNNSLNIYAEDDGDARKPPCERRPDYVVDSIHLSCESDIFEGNNVKYGGIIIYSRDGKSEWRTANGKHCKSGYVVIQNSASQRVKKWPNEPGTVHGAVYRSAFGESVNDHKIVGEGFSIQTGEFVTTSGVFNAPPESHYHDGERKHMSELTKRCVNELIKTWKEAGNGSRTLGKRNFKVDDLLLERPRSSCQLPDVDLTTIHISCKSDVYSPKVRNYGGIMIISRDGQPEWTTANGKRCKTGYVVIQDTSSTGVTEWMGIEPGEVHGAVYRNAFGESIRDHAVEAAGFSVRCGVFVPNSRVFNTPSRTASTVQETMSQATKQKLGMVVNDWKQAGEKYSCLTTSGNQNYNMDKFVDMLPHVSNMLSTMSLNNNWS